MTPGFSPGWFTIYCLGSRYGIDSPADTLLADCFVCRLDLADRNKVASIGFPAISTGAFGYPIQKATKVGIKVAKDALPECEHVDKVRFVLFKKRDYGVFRDALEGLM